jgi:2-hydroxy-6-oxonona-2,4-dienedioate hydrolase
MNVLKLVPQTPRLLESRWDDVPAARIHSRVGGAGPPVVLQHGYGVSGRYFLPLAEILAGDCTAFVPDLPGHGGTKQSGKALGVGDLADVLGDWLEAVGLERPTLVANSMGCQIVTELAVRRPDLVGPMVLIGPTVDPSRRAAPHQLFGMLRESTRDPALLGVAARDGLRPNVRQLLAAARSVLADRMELRLPAIDQPTVVVHGERDGFVSREWAQKVAALLPNGRLVVVPGQPHAVHFTRPDLVARIVRDLLAEEGEHAGRELPGSAPHRDVAAVEPHEAGVGQ